MANLSNPPHALDLHSNFSPSTACFGLSHGLNYKEPSAGAVCFAEVVLLAPQDLLPSIRCERSWWGDKRSLYSSSTIPTLGHAQTTEDLGCLNSL